MAISIHHHRPPNDARANVWPREKRVKLLGMCGYFSKEEMAEIMAGKIPISEAKSEMPESLLEVLISIDTAFEIGWLGL